eukprot:CAMPEP_0198229700 /NCGR_PEP_ID=MMETSP1445-20131203/114262_1 /TAXON_ID=36898 /ORGANISM="Pyramimonas sp., Strain CCMP2087" /LENGTH=217 /DNA_ID=CAMNT_0043910171 /DNA_START=167 /DNA_END=821 /DNA_ORIENTATION=+
MLSFPSISEHGLFLTFDIFQDILHSQRLHPREELHHSHRVVLSHLPARRVAAVIKKDLGSGGGGFARAVASWQVAAAHRPVPDAVNLILLGARDEHGVCGAKAVLVVDYLDVGVLREKHVLPVTVRLREHQVKHGCHADLFTLEAAEQSDVLVGDAPAGDRLYGHALRHRVKLRPRVHLHPGVAMVPFRQDGVQRARPAGRGDGRQARLLGQLIQGS